MMRDVSEYEIPHIGNSQRGFLGKRFQSYHLFFASLRLASRRHGMVPDRAYRMWKRYLGDQPRPFIGRYGDGTQFCGDLLDEYSLACELLRGYDRGTVEFLKSVAMKSSGAIVDVGANIGLFAASISRAIGQDRMVYAFEADPKTAERAAATAALNGCRSLKVVSCAISDVEADLTFRRTVGGSNLGMIVDGASNNDSALNINVHALTLDQILQALQAPAVSLLKVDVEGHEMSVFRGAAELIARDRPTIVFEYNPPLAAAANWSLPDAVEFCDRLARYESHSLGEDGSLGPIQNALAATHYINVCLTPRSNAG